MGRLVIQCSDFMLYKQRAPGPVPPILLTMDLRKQVLGKTIIYLSEETRRKGDFTDLDGPMILLDIQCLHMLN